MNKTRVCRISLRVAEWLSALVAGCLLRTAGTEAGLPIPLSDYDMTALTSATAYGFFVVITLQFVASLINERAPITSALYNFTGFVLYAASGALIIREYEVGYNGWIPYPEYLKTRAGACGGFMVITSLILFVDAIFEVGVAIKNRNK